MSDILTRLLLKTDDFDRNLKKGGKSVSQFEQGISSMASKAGKAFAGVAVAVGAGTTAYETLNKIMNSSQTLSDGLNEKIAKAKGSVDEFFYSIGSGDWTNFLSGMDETIRKAGELYRAMDQLGNTQISYGYFSDKYDTNIEAAREKATNTSLGKEERERALKEWQEAINEKKKAADTLRGDLLIALKNSLVAGNKLNANDVSLADFEKVLSYDIANPAERERIKAAQKQLYEQYKIKYEALERQKQGVATYA